MFAGNTMLLPKSMTSDPEVFNKGQLDRPGPSAGPFIVTDLDRTAQRITLKRNPKWWGTPPLLDSITYLVLDDKARIPALQNNTIDATGVASLPELTTARNTAGISIRRAPGASWYHFTFNGAPGSILADKALRLAVAKGIDRQAIANVTQRGLVDKPVPLNNHIFVAGQEGYQDNSAAVAFDPEKAKQELDALGWRLNGQFREKDGRQLVIRDVLFDADTTKQVAQIAQNSLAQIGVKLELDTKGGTGFFTQLHHPRRLRHRAVQLGRRRVLAVLPEPDLHDQRGQQLRQDQQSGDRREGRADVRRTRPRQGTRAGQRTRQDDLRHRFQPAAVPVGGQRRGAQQPGELRPGGHRRSGLHQDRLHEVTRCTARGIAAGSADSTTAAAPIAPTSSRIPKLAGTASSSFARPGKRPMSPSYTASTMSSAARSRTSIALWPAVAKLDENRIGNQRHDLLGDRPRGDQVAATGDDGRRPGELRHLGGEVVGLGFEFQWLRGEFAERDGRVQRLAVGHRTVVEFAEPDPADQVGLVAIRRLALEQKPRRLVEHGPQSASTAAAGDRVGGSAPPVRRNRRPPR